MLFFFLKKKSVFFLRKWKFSFVELLCWPYGQDHEYVCLTRCDLCYPLMFGFDEIFSKTCPKFFLFHSKYVL